MPSKIVLRLHTTCRYTNTQFRNKNNFTVHNDMGGLDEHAGDPFPWNKKKHILLTSSCCIIYSILKNQVYANFITSNGLDPSTTCNHSSSTYYEYHGLSAKYRIPIHKITQTASEANIWIRDDLIRRQMHILSKIHGINNVAVDK